MKKEEITAEEKTRTVFVGNAPLSSTRKGIKKLFSQFGTVENVRLHCFTATNGKITKKVVLDFSFLDLGREYF